MLSGGRLLTLESKIIPSFKPLMATKGSKTSPKEKLVDIEIKKWLKHRDLIVKAVNYQKNNEVDKINKLIDKWRSICHQASNYLLNSMQIKIMHMGGYSAWKAKQKEKQSNQSFGEESHKESLSGFIDSEEFSNLSSFEQSDIMDQFNELSNESILSSDDESLEDQLNMEEFYSLLKMDYALVYDVSKD